jgi:hypothetical protein
MPNKPSNDLTVVKKNQDVTLPTIQSFSAPMLSAVTKAMGVDRNIIADDEQIAHAWANLPRLLNKIPPHLRDERMVRLCVSVASGLFDSAINYAWNAAVSELRNKVRRFGIEVIPQILDQKGFDENKLIEMKDAELLDLCLSLNLISEDGYFLLSQCREIRNNFSAAHPSIGNLDEDEVLTFLSRCGKHALSEEKNPVGVDIQGLITALKASKFSIQQKDAWFQRLDATFEAQRELIFGMLHGMYCDPAVGQEARLNAIAICKNYSTKFSTKTKSELIDRHQDYKAKGDENKIKASQEFFRELSLLPLLTEGERHYVVSTACKKLMSVHNSYDNFYNEPPFAERLHSISEQGAIPASAQMEFVEAVVTCAAGNPYGVSSAAMPFYKKMISSFTPKEVQTMLALPDQKGLLANRVAGNSSCKTRYINLLLEIDPTTVLASDKPKYKKWTAQKSKNVL